jgi:hypothetical protein
MMWWPLIPSLTTRNRTVTRWSTLAKALSSIMPAVYQPVPHRPPTSCRISRCIEPLDTDTCDGVAQLRGPEPKGPSYRRQCAGTPPELNWSLTTLTQPAAAAGADWRPPLVVVVARVDDVAPMAVRGRAPAVEACKVPDVSGRVVGAADVATAACGADRPAPIALDRASRRPTRLAAQATTVSGDPDNVGRANPRRRTCLPAPAPVTT